MEALESIAWVALGFAPTMAIMEISFRMGRKRMINGKGKSSSMTSSSVPPMTKIEGKMI
jgi:hypothetical protein